MNLEAIKEKISIIVKKLQGFFNKDFMVGLDIGSSSVKIAQFIKKEDGLQFLKADLREIKLLKGEAQQEEIISVLKDLFKEIDLKKAKIVVAINCPHTAIRSIETPYMPQTELKSAINLEAKNYFPFPVDDASLDFEVLETVVDKGIKKYKVLVAVSPKITVNKYLSLLNEAGIKPSAFIMCPLALQRVVESLHPEKTEVKAALDIGKHFSELAIFSGEYLVFSRKIPVAGDDFTDSMTGVLVSDKGKTHLSLDEAERIKKDVGLVLDAEAKMIEDKVSTTQILSMLRTPAEQLVNEIDRCFDYYREETKGSQVSELLLFGRGSLLKGLDKFISKELSLEVKVADPLAGVKKAADLQDQDLNLCSLALATGSALSQTKGVNLLPEEIKHEAKQLFKRSTLNSIIAGSIVGLILIYIGMLFQLGNFQKRSAAAKMELGSLTSRLDKVKNQGLINSVLKDEPFWDDVFIELSNLTPVGIYATEISFKGNHIQIKAIAKSFQVEELISQFVLDLEKGIFKGVQLLTNRNLGSHQGNEFELKSGFD